MEIVVFTLNAVVIYLLSDRIVTMIERKRGEILKQRQVVFFAIFLVLAILSFSILKTLFGG